MRRVSNDLSVRDVLLAMALGPLLACAGAQPLSPVEVTQRQIAHLENGDEAAARALLTPEARIKAPQWPARAELPDRASVVEVERTALWAGDGRELELVRGASGWTIRRGVLQLFRLDSADGALSAFGRALEARDLGLVLALMPEPSQRLQLPGSLERAFTARTDAWLALGQAIAAGRVSWVVREPDRAEALVEVAGAGGGERRVVLIREIEGAGGWKVFDVQPWSGYIAP